jgi:anion-transporting  ArsA/GET3 family ATPase
VIALLTDVSLCEFIGVAIPERMSLEETAALAARLKKLKVPMRRLLINGLVPEEAASTCDFCDARRKAQVSVLEEFRGRFGRSPQLFVASQQPHEIHGARDLLEHFAHWEPLNDSTFQHDRKVKLRVSKPAVKNIRGGRKAR